MKRIVLAMVLGIATAAQGVDATHLEEVMAPLCSCGDVALVTVEGVASHKPGEPAICSCMKLKSELFPARSVKNWYAAFADCRRTEHHELIRLGARFFVPSVAAFTAYELLKAYSSYIRVPATVAAFAALFYKGKRLYRAISDYLDVRADRASLKACPSPEERTEILAYLEGMANKAASAPAPEPDALKYEMLHINAYDKTQASHCSYITFSLAIPISWLFAGENPRKLAGRIRALRASLAP